jgi:hypothetical protein
MTENDKRAVASFASMSASRIGTVFYGDQLSAADAGDGVLEGLAHVDEDQLLAGIEFGLHFTRR